MLSVDGATTMMSMPNSTPLKRSVGSEPPKMGREGQKPDAHHDERHGRVGLGYRGRRMLRCQLVPHDGVNHAYLFV